MSKDDKDLVRLASAHGWTVTRTRKNHLQWRSPDGAALIVSGGTPSDWRAQKNLRARLRRAGLTEA